MFLPVVVHGILVPVPYLGALDQVVSGTSRTNLSLWRDGSKKLRSHLPLLATVVESTACCELAGELLILILSACTGSQQVFRVSSS